MLKCSVVARRGALKSGNNRRKKNKVSLKRPTKKGKDSGSIFVKFLEMIIIFRTRDFSLSPCVGLVCMCVCVCVCVCQKLCD